MELDNSDNESTGTTRYDIDTTIYRPRPGRQEQAEMLAQLSESASRYAVALGHDDQTVDVEPAQAFFDASYQYFDDVSTAGLRMNGQRLQDLQALHESSMSAAKSALDSLGQQVRRAEAEYTQRANRGDVLSGTAMLFLTSTKFAQDPDTSSWQANDSHRARPSLPSAIDELRSAYISFMDMVQSEVRAQDEATRTTSDTYDSGLFADEAEAGNEATLDQLSSCATAKSDPLPGRKRSPGIEGMNIAFEDDHIDGAFIRSPGSQSTAVSKRRKLNPAPFIDQ